MARLSRLAIDRQLHHLVHRAAKGERIYAVDADHKDYLAALLEVSRESGIAIHAYALLPGQINLLLTPEHGEQLASMMQRVGRRYVARFNARHGRNGSPWAGRYRTGVLQASRYLFDAMRHVEMLPVAAGLVVAPELWPASSAAHHLGQRHDPLITDHSLFWTLGNTPFEREISYRRQFGDPADARPVGSAIDEATEKGWVLGDSAFVEELSGQQARRLLPLQRGRRPRASSAQSQSDPI